MSDLSVVFDLDGTLVDSAPDLHVAVNHMLTATNAAPLSIQEVTRFIGKGVAHLVQQVMVYRQIDQAMFDILFQRFSAYYEAHACVLTKPYPHVQEFLDRLCARAVRIGLCTNKPAKPTMQLLDKLCWTHHFSVIVAGDTLDVKKPNPRPLLYAFEKLGAQPNSIYIGDSETDAATAQAAQIRFILFEGGYRHTDVSDLPHLAHFKAYDSAYEMIIDLKKTSLHEGGEYHEGSL